MPNSLPLQPNASVGGGRFTLVRVLGRGGMGEVWLAQDERLREPVALKFLPPEVRSDATALDDLRRETSRSRRLSHPNIVRIHDLHEDAGGDAFIAMEYVDGHTMAAFRVEQPTRVFHWDFLRPSLLQLCAALEYAHGEKVVHRDLKPANLMLDSKWRLKLADFGIAATISDSVSRVSHQHATSGTLAYMSPQQLAGKRPTVADDIYALGATLYELLTSKPPFYTGDLTHQILNEPPEPIQERLAALELQNDFPPEIATLVMACLAKDPDHRPQSAATVASWLSGPASLSSESADSEASIQPAAHRSSRTVWFLGSALAAAVLLAGGWYWVAHRTSSKGNVAQNETVFKNGSVGGVSDSRPEKSSLASRTSVPFAGDLAGTTWKVKDSDGESYVFHFEPNGVLKYETANGIHPNGKWQQNGTDLTININDGFVTLSAAIKSKQMQGRAVGRGGKSWTWEATPGT